MRTLILDQYAHQSLIKRLFWNTVTGLGWVFWIYLWMPLVEAISLLIGSHPEQATSVASGSILALLASLTAHATVVVITITAFFAWSLLQWKGKRYRSEALEKQRANSPLPVLPLPHSMQHINYWRSVQSMVVSHHETSGLVQKVDILRTKKQDANRGYPVALPSTAQPLIRRFESGARSAHR
jgi:poly-beta-1,6-N-acetyl-D-glucosamine biosynthesis protein PgaD